NNSAASSTCTITTSGCTVSLDLYRNTFTLTVSRNTTHISSASATTSAVHGDNYYRWGQAVSISATANTNSHFTSWTQSGTTGTFGSATNASTTFTMGKGNSTVTAGGAYDTYAVTLNRNCSTTATGSTSATATYNSTTLSAITVPTCANATGTRTLSGFTAGTNASDATVTFGTQPTGSSCNSSASPKTCSSTNTTTYAFNGWHDTSGTGALVASTASTPALQASVSGYTNSSSQWTRTSAATLYAGWNASAGSYSSINLPSITKTGYTCGWSTSSTATDFTYASGGSLVPSSSTTTLYGICKANTYNLVVTGDANVSTITVRAGSTSGTATTCTKSSTTFTCSSLTYGTKYYLFPTFASGYGFNSWAKTDSATNAVLGSTSTENTYYQMGAGNGALTLTSKAYKTMQTMSDSDCTTTATTVVDNRDSELYVVQRLADGNCWMLDNLRLDPTSVSLATLQGNTNASNQTLTYFKNGGGSTSDQYATAGVSNWTSSYSYSAPLTSASYKDATTTSYGVGSGKIGVYYNYCAASAGSYCYGNGTSPGTSTGDATEDICPAGWRMPANGFDGGEYLDLFAAYNSDDSAFINALSTPLSGAFTSGSAERQGTGGFFWVATRNNSTYMNFLIVYPSDVRQPSSDYRYYGHSVRCVKKTTYMQDVTNSVLNELIPDVGDNVDLVDKRDGEIYKVARLADGNVWMLDNLALDPTSVSLATLQGNTNASNQTLTYFKNGGGSSPYPATGVNTTWASSSDNKYNEPKVVTTYKDTTTTNYGAGSGKIGVYYNFCAASAGSYCYDGNGTGNATEDLCPAGWKMPTTLYSNEYPYLYTAYNSDATAFKQALSTPLSGSFRGSATSQGSNGWFWSSTRYDDDSMYSLYVDSSSVDPLASHYRHYGFSMRCVKKIPYMQDVTDADLNYYMPNTGDSTKLADKRDDRVYTVAKLADNKYWMTQNLDLAGGTTISCDTTDCDSSYTIPTTNGWQSGGRLPASSTSGFDSPEGVSVYNSNNDVCSNDGSVACYSYYSWAAATISSGSAYSQNYVDAPYSICPKGWHLPSGKGGTDSFTDTRALAIALGGSDSINNYIPSTSPTGTVMSNTLRSSPYNFVMNGYYLTAAEGFKSNNGTLWTSTYYHDGLPNYLRLYSTTQVVFADYQIARAGQGVRCIFNNSRTITLNGDSGVSDFIVNGNTVARGSSIDLVDGKSYIITINYNSGYVASSTPLVKTSGSGTVSGTSFTVGSDAATLYANSIITYGITFDGDSGVKDFTVDGSTVSKGGTKALAYGQTYNITINYNSGYVASSTPLVKTSGSGTVSGTSFTVGNGIATLSASSEAGGLYSLTRNYTGACSSYRQRLADDTNNNYYVDTGYIINWSNDFEITGSFKIPTEGKRYLLIGNYNDSSKTLNFEVNTSNQIRLYMFSGDVNETYGRVVAGTRYYFSLSWTASTKKYKVAFGTNSDISSLPTRIQGTYNSAPTGSATNSLWIGYDHRSSKTIFEPLKYAYAYKIIDFRQSGSVLSDLNDPTLHKLSTGATVETFRWTNGATRYTTSSTMPASNLTLSL
ncbi:hypothetical protein IKF28_03735, partial [Candidatus Saccharibacteria bacterium]|nr:hypothetical protein [Candidatus Saccharibacteria bacterium]